MKNWSKHIEWFPDELVYPHSETEIQQLVETASRKGKRIRMIGSGHSFNPLWVTKDILVSLDDYQGLVEVNPSTHQVRVRAGTKLNQLGKLLFAHGLAMENLGDIDAQSIGGTIATGTHGTGLSFGTISTQVKGIKFVNGHGDLVTCSPKENPDLFKAAQVSLGALGIITELTLQCVPAYRLELVSRPESLAQLLGDLPQRWKEHRNFEFYWFPHTKKVWTKSSNVVEDRPDKMGLGNILTEYLLENYAFQVLCDWAHLFPQSNPAIARISAASIPNVRKVFPSHKVFATKRLVRFKEMEYNIPLEEHQVVLESIIRACEKYKFPVHFPIENRVVKADDAFLSPAYQRDAAYIACHVYYKKDHEAYFKVLEDIFTTHGGRPHWGKMHSQTANDLAKKYPRWNDFLTIRKAQDPKGIFINEYLQKVLLA